MTEGFRRLMMYKKKVDKNVLGHSASNRGNLFN